MSRTTPPNTPRVSHLPTRDTPTINRVTTQGRWLRLAEDLARLATDPDFDQARQRVGMIVAREVVALGSSSAWPQREDKP